MKEEMIKKAKEAKSVEELLALAKENGMELAEEQAKVYFAQLHPTAGELADDELDNVSGGCGGAGGSSDPVCPTCGTNEYVSMLNPEGDYWCNRCNKRV